MVEVLVSSVCLVIVSTAVASAVQFTATQGREQRIRAFLVGEAKGLTRQLESEALPGRLPLNSNVVLNDPAWGDYRLENTLWIDPNDRLRFGTNVRATLLRDPSKTVLLRSAVRSADVFTITAIPWTTFGIENDATRRMPTVIRLSEFGIRPRDRLRLVAVGGHSHHNPPIPTSVGRMAVIACTADMVLSVWGEHGPQSGSPPAVSSSPTALSPRLRLTSPCRKGPSLCGSPQWTRGTPTTSTAPSIPGAWRCCACRRPQIWVRRSRFWPTASAILGCRAKTAGSTARFRAKTHLTVAGNLLYSVDGRPSSSPDPTQVSSHWLLIYNQFMHPTGGAGRTPADFRCAVRRWVAPRSFVRLELTYWAFHSQTAPGVGDGMDFVVTRGDTILGNHSINSGGGRVEQTIVLNNVQAGEVFDFRFGPRTSDGSDHGNMRATFLVR